jgi:hypothetical protein
VHSDPPALVDIHDGGEICGSVIDKHFSAMLGSGSPDFDLWCDLAGLVPWTNDSQKNWICGPTSEELPTWTFDSLEGAQDDPFFYAFAPLSPPQVSIAGPSDSRASSSTVISCPYTSLILAPMSNSPEDQGDQGPSREDGPTQLRDNQARHCRPCLTFPKCPRNQIASRNANSDHAWDNHAQDLPACEASGDKLWDHLGWNRRLEDGDDDDDGDDEGEQ